MTKASIEIPTKSRCLARAANAKARGARSGDLSGKLFWQSLEQSWRQTAHMLAAVEQIEQFVRSTRD